MLQRLQNRLTYANVTATLALFIALGGTTYAAINLPSHSVGSRQLKTHAVTGTRIAPGAVSSSKVRANTLSGHEIKESGLAQVPSAAQAQNAATLAGQTPGQIAATGAAAAKVRCPPGTEFGGGYCVESGPHGAATWFIAVTDCFVLGRELPTVTELLKAPSGGGVEWTRDVQSDAGGLPVFTVNASSHAIAVANGGSASTLTFRCVQPPSN